MALLGNLTGSSQFFNDPDFYNEIATQSLRFDDGSSHKLTRTFSGAVDNDKKMTISVWVKRGNLSGSTQVIYANYNQVRFLGELAWYSDNTLTFDPGGNGNGASNSYTVRTTAVFRDVGAWYHIVLAYDSTQGTDTNRVKLYVNGTQQTLTAPSGYTFPPQNYAHLYSYAGANNTIGEYGANFNSGYLDGYLSEFNFIDGLTLDPTYFGETKNGVWIAKEYTGSYGTNGFRLQFDQTGTGTASTSTIGADTSGNTNHFTSSGIVASDCNMPDSPENNFATWNPLRKSESASTFSEGNLKAVIPVSSANSICATMGVSSGKYYWEVQRVAERPTLGVGDSTDVASVSGFPTGGNEFGYFADSGNKYPGDSSYGATYANGDIIGFALDMDAGTLVAYKNNASQGTLATGLTDTIFPFVYNGTASLTVIGNFGQDSSFAGTKTAQGNTDANGIGDFYYAPPSGYLALCSANLPEPTISPNSATQADDYFNTVLWTGNGGTQSITGVGHKPDWVWIKERDSTSSHALYDSSRGALKQLESNTTDAESTASSMLTSFDSDGFSVGSSGAINQSSQTYVGWNWKANGGTTSSNSDGSITSTVQANTTAGFSIVTYTGNGTAGATVGHSLGTKPEMIILKERNASGNWVTYHEYANANAQNGYIALNLGSSWASNSASWNNTSPTSSVFTLGNGTDVNTNNHTMLAYCFHSVEGYSKFGGYTGNSSSDGVFIYTGFRPAWFMVKVANGFTNNWTIYDSTTTTFNPDDTYLLANGNGAEVTANAIDFVSNGIKLRNSSQAENNSSGTYIYMAFAEAPFKYANAR